MDEDGGGSHVLRHVPFLVACAGQWRILLIALTLFSLYLYIHHHL